MQLSEFRDLLANDGFAATFQTMGQYRTELLRTLDGLRAQADARPVAWTNAKELESVKNVGEGYARAIWGAENPNFATIALYTHPEASAPGLSDVGMPALIRIFTSNAEAWCKAEDTLDAHRIECEAVAAFKTALTRASAATVAEPTVVRGVRVCSISDIECTKQCGAICHHEATQQQAEPVRHPDHEFKNFHRLLCERFGYVHDEKDWKRDQISLIEWISKQRTEPAFVTVPVTPTPEMVRAGNSLSAAQWNVESIYAAMVSASKTVHDCGCETNQPCAMKTDGSCWRAD